jgi:Zn-dependent M28 family amino/carboxypeptidase
MKLLRNAALCAIALLAATGVRAADSSALITDIRTLSSPEFAGRLTGTPGSLLAQAYITRRFQELGIKSFGASYAMPFAFVATRNQIKTDYPSAVNLIGHIRGSTNPERIMVVSAHYDHLGVTRGRAYLGADDNASGVAAMLAVAAHFQQHPPRHTIVFAAFDGEEFGLRGSREFVEAPPFPIKSVALNLNFDMVSRNDKNEIYAVGTRYTPSLKALVAKAAEGSTLKVIPGHDSRPAGAPSDYDWTASSDHHPFHKAGIPFLYFGVEDHADYHKPGDTFEKIDQKFFSEVARVLVSAAAIFDQNLDTIK